jgi:hypothetical protein
MSSTVDPFLGLLGALATQRPAQFDNVGFVDPVAIDEAVQRGAASLGRLLKFERYLDTLEVRKRERGNLPARVERRAIAAFKRAERDAAIAAGAIVDAAAAFESAGVASQALPAIADALPEAITVERLLRSALPEIQEQVIACGIPREEWLWATSLVSGASITISKNGDNVRVAGGKLLHELGVRHPSPLPLLDGTTFADSAYRMFKRHPAENGKPASQSSWYGSALGLARFLILAYQRRSREAQARGVVVLPTGFPPAIIVAIVVAVILIVGILVTVLCDKGTIKNGTVCAIGRALIFLALLVWCIWTFVEGNPPRAEDGGILCVMSFSDEDDPDQG